MSTIIEQNEHGEDVQVTMLPNGGIVRELLRPVPTIIEAKSWAAWDFYRKFTSAEWILALTLAKTDPVAEYFINTLNAAIACGKRIYADDQDTLAGLDYLSQLHGNIRVLGVGRKEEILA